MHSRQQYVQVLLVPGTLLCVLVHEYFPKDKAAHTCCEKKGMTLLHGRKRLDCHIYSSTLLHGIILVLSVAYTVIPKLPGV